MKLISWNVNGVRAVVKKNFYDFVEDHQPDVLCLQETKADPEQVREALRSLLGYTVYACSAQRKGYSGTAVATRIEPLSVRCGIDCPEHDTEGRVLTLEFADFYLVDVYTPNSGAELLRLEYRAQWDIAFYRYLKSLEQVKPVLVCGDMNVAHTDIDLANPAANYNKAAGYMQVEIDGMERYLQGGLVDTFRHFYPDKTAEYSWWSYRGGARSRNVGWRIDYFLASRDLMPRVEEAFILQQVEGSDHCPVGVTLRRD